MIQVFTFEPLLFGSCALAGSLFDGVLNQLADMPTGCRSKNMGIGQIQVPCDGLTHDAVIAETLDVLLYAVVPESGSGGDIGGGDTFDFEVGL